MNSNETPRPSSDGRVFPWTRSLPQTVGIGFLAYLVKDIVAIYFSMVFSGLTPGSAESTAAMAVSYAVTFAIAIYVFTRFTVDGGPLTAGLQTYGPARPRLSVGAVFGKAFLAYLLVIVVIVVLSRFLPAPYSPAADVGSKLSGSAFGIFAVMTVVLAPLLEETLFRGLFQNALVNSIYRDFRLSRRTAETISVIVTAAIFAAAHGTATGFVGLFVLGLGFGELYRRTGDIRTSMVLHAINNGIATLVLANQT